MNWNLKKYIKLRGVQILALGFVVIILIGTILLTLPISTASGESTSFLDVEMFGKTFSINFRKLNFNFVPVWNRFIQFFF